MLENINVLCHSAIRLEIDNKIIYIDPYSLTSNANDADLIFITHDHYDHFSIEDIKKVEKSNTIFIIPESMLENAIKSGIKENRIIKIKPNQNYKYENLKIETIPAYNVNKKFHPKENNWVGYLIEYNNVVYYIAGDTDITNENKKVKCDIAFVPIGGTYTMNYKEAAKLINEIKPKFVVPIHYGKIVGTKQDALNFEKLLNEDIKCKIMI
ncbi:MAG: MBL fold metallo-hydrolase [Clostridia bacterium]|jgi:L-ascorbate metabolism protein UlaG (beta-lactamase superfamily)|nr:predicted Zn-dependent hydrolases of the beta-lactamase fold [Clostridium sp. CAG:571]HJJ07436.1 MBL fold metallo-hydrolase [Clostridiaceae bacterium]HJJ14667.1 MBL fold metallo-hydrolase [Clostridiaceae bacterium]